MSEPEIYIDPILNRTLTEEEMLMLGMGVTKVEYISKEEFDRRWPSQDKK